MRVLIFYALNAENQEIELFNFNQGTHPWLKHNESN